MTRVFVWIVFFHCLFLAPLQAQANSTVTLTQEEQAFAREHAPVRIGVVAGNEPYSFYRDGKISGLSIDILHAVEARTGLRFDIRIGNWTEVYNSFKDGRLDAIDAISLTEQRKEFTLYTKPYHVRETVLFENTDNPLSGYRGLDSLKGKKKIGVIKDIYYRSAMQGREGIEIVEYDNYVDLMKSLAFGWLDGVATGALTGEYLARENHLPNLRVAGPLGIAGMEKEDYRIGVRKDQALLHQVISKGLDAMPPAELAQIEERWKKYRGEIRKAISKLRLTPEEEAFVRQHPVLKVGLMPDYGPFSFVAKGEAKGFSVALLDRIADSTGVRFEPVVDSWSNLLDAFRKGELDVIANISYTDKRKSYTLFSREYYRIPNVVFVRNDFGAYDGLDSLRGKRVGITRDVFYKEPLAAVVGAGLVEFDDQLEMMRALSFGRIDAIATAINTGNQHAKQLGLLNLTIAGELLLKNVENEDLRFGVRPQFPLLQGLINRSLEAIPVEDMLEIENRWLATRQEPEFDYRPMARILAAALAVIALILYWGNKLRRLNQQLAAANAQLRELTLRDALTGLHNRNYLEQRIGEVFAICQRNGIRFSVAMIDIDHFKQINDRYGHPFGDACLKQIGALLSQHFQRDSDAVARYGGEEFIVFLSGYSDVQLREHLERLRQRFEQHVLSADGVTVNVTVSIGAYSATPGSEDRHEAFLATADDALYEAKRTGRNRVVLRFDQLAAPMRQVALQPGVRSA